MGISQVRGDGVSTEWVDTEVQTFTNTLFYSGFFFVMRSMKQLLLKDLLNKLLICRKSPEGRYFYNKLRRHKGQREEESGAG